MPDQKAPIPRDSFVNRVVVDKNKHPNVQLLSGFLGDASEAGQTRLYFDPELSDYVDIPDDAILHTEPMPKETSPLGGFFVWIDKEREVTHGRAGEQRTKARFLEGRIQQAQMKQAAAQQLAVQQAQLALAQQKTLTPGSSCLYSCDQIPDTLIGGPTCFYAVCTYYGCNSAFCHITNTSVCCYTNPICPSLGGCPSVACNPWEQGGYGPQW